MMKKDELSYPEVLKLLLSDPTKGKLAAKALLRGRSTRDTRFEEVLLHPEDIQETVHNVEDTIPEKFKQRRFKNY
jgi:hypothetical protein